MKNVGEDLGIRSREGKKGECEALNSLNKSPILWACFSLEYYDCLSRYLGSIFWLTHIYACVII